MSTFFDEPRAQCKQVNGAAYFDDDNDSSTFQDVTLTESNGKPSEVESEEEGDEEQVEIEEEVEMEESGKDDVSMDDAQIDGALVEGRTVCEEKAAEAAEHAATVAARTACPTSQAADGGVTEALLLYSGGPTFCGLEREVGTVLDVLWSTEGTTFRGSVERAEDGEPGDGPAVSPVALEQEPVVVQQHCRLSERAHNELDEHNWFTHVGCFHTVWYVKYPSGNEFTAPKKWLTACMQQRGADAAKVTAFLKRSIDEYREVPWQANDWHIGLAGGAPDSGHGLLQDSSLVDDQHCSPQHRKERDAAKQTQKRNEGLLVARGDFRVGSATGQKERLITGQRHDCLADALAYATNDREADVRAFLGDDRSFERAARYVASTHPALALDDVSDELLNAKDGVEHTLLGKRTGSFILQQIYNVNGEKRYHCAFLDAGKPWRREHLELGWLTGHGVLKDNQSDVLVSLVEHSDRSNMKAARDFFHQPYPNQPDIRISRVYELVSAEEAARRAEVREEKKEKERCHERQRKRVRDDSGEQGGEKRVCFDAIQPVMRPCAGCNEEKPKEQFSSMQRRKYGCQGTARCKACVASDIPVKYPQGLQGS